MAAGEREKSFFCAQPLQFRIHARMAIGKAANLPRHPDLNPAGIGSGLHASTAGPLAPPGFLGRMNEN